MGRLLLIAVALAGATARADERIPAPRPAPDPAVAACHAFFSDLKKGDTKAAHARVGGWAKPMFGNPELLARYWDRLVQCHGPLREVAEVGRDGPTVGGRVRFERQEYVFAAAVGADGRPDQLQLVPYPVGGAVLLRASHGVPVTAADPTAPADGLVTFAVPGLHADQVPLDLRVSADPPAALKGYKLRKRDDGLNWVVEATVNPGKGGAIVHWEAAVLTRSAESEPVWGGRPPAAEPEVPPKAARWLRPTACVQSDDPGIVARAAQLWAKTPDVRDYAQAVAEWVSQNRGTGQPFLTLDAKTALGCGGSCTSRANLAAALLRARGIPARTVAHLPAWAGPLYVHWLTEYWHPGAGWQMIEPSRGEAWLDRAGLVVLNVATPDDEDESVWPNRSSGVMAGAPRLSSRELDGPLRTPGVLGGDLRTWGLALPLAGLYGDDFRSRLIGVHLAVSTRFGWLMPHAPELFVNVDRLARWVAALPGRLHDAQLDALWSAARRSHAGLARDGAAGRSDPRRQSLAAAAQAGGVGGLTAALRLLAGE